MLIPNIEERTHTAVQTLNEWRYVQTQNVAVEYTDKFSREKLPAGEDFAPFLPPYTLFEQEKYYLFRASFTVEKKEHCKAYLRIETFIDGVACTIRPQGLLYLNGEVVQGVDINHTHVCVDAGTYEMLLVLYTHTFVRSLPVEFSLCYEDERIKDAYYDLYVPLEVSKLLIKTTDEYVATAAAMEKAVHCIDFREKYSDAFFASLTAMRQSLQKNYYTLPKGKKPTVYCIGHTHIDVAWLWTLAQTKEKAERSFATVLKLMDEYPEYRFMSSQPQLFAFFKERNPALYARVKEKIQEGRWEVEGAMWLEADCNLTSGESLVRQITEGKRFFAEEFGVDCKTVFEPDVFGYSAALPQIMKKAGLDTFITAKIGLNDTNRMPFDTFEWQGIDGSSVLAYLISTCTCDPRTGVYDQNETTYVGRLTAAQVLGTWNRYRPKECNDATITTYGWGDGGGGPTREMLERQRRYANGLPGLPQTKTSSLSEAIDKIKRNFYENCRALRRKPVWRGEIYFEYHRGTYTSVPKIKTHNRRGEFALLNAEQISVAAQVWAGKTYPAQTIENDWKILLLNQFHDILPGSAIKEVYDESDKQFAALFASTSNVTESAVQAVAVNVQTSGGIFAYNPNGFAASGTAQINGQTRVLRNIPPLGYAVVRLAPVQNKIKIGTRRLENDAFLIKFNARGEIVSLYDKRFGRETVQAGAVMNELVAYEDMPYQYDNWELAPYYAQKEYPVASAVIFEKIQDGDAAGFCITRAYGSSRVVQKVLLYDGIDRIDFVTDIDWKEKRQILKARFPFALLVDRAAYDIQFGHLERNTSSNHGWDAAKFECVGQKWVDFSEHNYGVSLLNDGKYGYGASGNVLTLTLCKSGSYPYDGASDEIPAFTYALFPHGGDFRAGGTIEAAYALNRPLLVQTLPAQEGNLPETYSLAVCETEGVFIETVKQANDGDGVVLRMYEGYKESKEVVLRLGFTAQKAWLCDLLEKEEKELRIQDGKITFGIQPFAIVTVKVK